MCADPASPLLSDGYTVYTPGLSERPIGGTSVFYHQDALGSTVATTDASGYLTSDQRFDAFGQKSWYVGSPTVFGFGGKHQYQTDAESGLLLLGHRYYDPSLGRFISQDPAQDDSNWYAYCGNNPLVAVDPDGRIAVPPVVIVAVAAAVVGAAVLTYDYYHDTAPLTKAEQRELKQIKDELIKAARKAKDKDAEKTISKLRVTRKFQRGKPDGDDSTSITTSYRTGPRTTVRADFFDPTSVADKQGRYETLLHESTHAARKYGRSNENEDAAREWASDKWSVLKNFLP